MPLRQLCSTACEHEQAVHARNASISIICSFERSPAVNPYQRCRPLIKQQLQAFSVAICCCDVMRLPLFVIHCINLGASRKQQL